MRIVNLTAHEVRLFAGDQVTMTWPPSGVVARIRERATPLSPLETTEGSAARMWASYDGEVDGLPDPQPRVRYLVSRVLAAAVPRPDLSFPWGEVRDDAGQIVGCRALGQFVGEGEADA